MFNFSNVSSARLLTCLAGVALSVPAFGQGALVGMNIHSKNYNDSRSNTATRGIVVYNATGNNGRQTTGFWNPSNGEYSEIAPQFGPGGQPADAQSRQFRPTQFGPSAQEIPGVDVIIKKTPGGHAALWDTSSNSVTDLSNPWNAESQAYSANADASLVAGTVYGNIDGRGDSRHAVQWLSGGTAQRLAIDPRYFASEARAVSLAGDTIVGAAWFQNMPGSLNDPRRSEGAIWRNGSFSSVSSMLTNPATDSLEFTHISDDGGNCFAAISTTRSNSKGGMIYDINTGDYAILSHDFNGDGIVDDMDLGVTELNSLTADGALIGGSIQPDGGLQSATIWLRQGVFGMNYTEIDAAAYMSSLGITGLSGWTFTSVDAISDDGLMLSGSGINPLGHTDIWATTVPTPGALILGSFGTLLAIRRRR